MTEHAPDVKMVKIFNSKGVCKPVAEYSHVAVAEGGKVIFVAGQNGYDVDGTLLGKGDIRVQTEQTLKNIRAILEACGAKMSDVCKTTIYLKDMQERKEMYEVYKRYFKPPYPPNVLVEAKLATPDILIEIEAMAVVK